MELNEGARLFIFQVAFYATLTVCALLVLFGVVPQVFKLFKLDRDESDQKAKLVIQFSELSNADLGNMILVCLVGSQEFEALCVVLTNRLYANMSDDYLKKLSWKNKVYAGIQALPREKLLQVSNFSLRGSRQHTVAEDEIYLRSHASDAGASRVATDFFP